MIDKELIKQYCKIADSLRPRIECVGDHEKRLLNILPEYQEFLDRLVKEGQFTVLDELKFSHLKAKNSELESRLQLRSYWEKKDHQKFESIQFPDTPKYQRKKNIVKLPLLEKFAVISRTLRGINDSNITNTQIHAKNIREILPDYQNFLNELRENKSDLLGELWWPQIAAIDSLYSVAWPEFMALTILGTNGDGNSIAYVNSRGQTLKESVDWVLSGNMKHSGNIEFLEPAKFYKHWNDINFPCHISFEKNKVDKPKRIYYSIKEVLDDTINYSDCAHFVATKVRISGLPINDGKPIESPLVLNNWFGKNSRVNITTTPYNPIWDS